jgi:hypothetical protein
MMRRSFQKKEKQMMRRRKVAEMLVPIFGLSLQ